VSGEAYKFFVLFGVCIAYAFAIYGFLSFCYHTAIDRNKRFAEKDKEEWFRKGFIAGCSEMVDVVIKHRFEQEIEKEQTK
jgi:hypothetical protein